MLIRFSVENFLSFDEKQILNMIPAKRISREKKEHLVALDKMSLLRTATVYGANASGKTNLIEAIRFAKYIIMKKIPNDSKKMYCRVREENIDKVSKFEFEFFKNNKYYAYGFTLNLQEQTVSTEWLYELLPGDSSQIMLFERETKPNTLILGESIELSETDKMRFNTYKLDFEGNNTSLFITEMNRNKKFDKDSSLLFFKDVYNWFENDLVTIMPEQPITDFEYFYGDSENSTINEIIEAFDTGISKVKIKKVSIPDFKKLIPSEIAEDMIKNFNDRLEQAEKDTKVRLSMRLVDAFYNIEGKKGEEPNITTIIMEHNNSFSDFEFSEESDGTRRLFDLLDILINGEKNKVYVIDEMERSLHPKLTYRFMELFIELLKDNNVQLIFTTHESTIMDQDLLRRDEIWFVERNRENVSLLYSLDRFKERYDKKISKAYLEGRYGAIPVFKKFRFKGGEEKCL